MNSRFGRELSAAVSASGMSLSDLAASCSRPSARLTENILESWTSGRAVPLGLAWLESVTRIEQALQLIPGSLTNLLGPYAPPHGRGSRQLFAPQTGQAPRNSEPNSHEHFTSLDENIVWTNEAVRKTMEEHLVVSADRRVVEHRVVLTAKRPNTSHALIHVASHFDRNSLPYDDYIGVHDIEGAEVAEVKVQELEDGVAKIVALALPADLPGTVQQIAYSHRFVSAEPVDTAIDRIFAWPLLYYMCTIRFDGETPDNLRLKVEASEELDPQRPRVEFDRPLDVHDAKASFRLEDAFGMRARVTWEATAS